MKGNKLKKMMMNNDIHICDIGIQPELIKKKKERKKPIPKNKDLFVMGFHKDNKPKKKVKNKSKMSRILDSMNGEISNSQYIKNKKRNDFI